MKFALGILVGIVLVLSSLTYAGRSGYLMVLTNPLRQISGSAAHAWDKRNPEVVRAEGRVMDIKAITLPKMRGFETKFIAELSKEKYKRHEPQGVLWFAQMMFSRQVKEVEGYVTNLEASGAVGKTLKESSLEMKELDRRVAEMNNWFFRVIGTINLIEEVDSGK